MKPAATLALMLTALLVAATLPVGADNDRQTLTGSFMSGFQDRVKPLRAVFTPAGDADWSVAFYFEFNGRKHVYRGTAQGTLGEGELRGRVQNETRQRTFTFEGRFENGVFEGTHAEVGRRGERETGTLSLRN